MFKIAHLSDLHAGYKAERLTNAQGINLREADGYVALSKMIKDIIDTDVDCAIISGDIFHIPTPDIRTIIFVQNQLRELWRANIPVYALAGNHDTNDVKMDIAASRLLHDESRNIYSHVEPYVKHEIHDGIFLHLVSHHMYTEQSETMLEIKTVDNAINIFATHGSCIDPLLKEKLHTEQSPREIVIPDFLLEENNWDYSLLGHIHERGWVGSKDGTKDTWNKKIYYNGSLIRRGFSDKECKLGRGWTLWKISSSGEFVPEYRKIAQRPQFDLPIINAINKSTNEITEIIVDNLKTTQINGVNFDPSTAPILRQKISNLDSATHLGLDWNQIKMNTSHAFKWELKKMEDKKKEEKTKKTDNNEQKMSGNIVEVYDNWVETSDTYQSVQEDLKESVRKQTRDFIEQGQEGVLESE